MLVIRINVPERATELGRQGLAMNLILRQALIAIAVAVTVTGLADLCIWMMSGA